jgi:hypothetical protein
MEREESKLRAAEMKFLSGRVKKKKTEERELESYTLGER